MAEPRLLHTKIVDVKCGDGVTIIEPSNLYGCELGDKVFVGPFCEVQRDVTIGARTRIQSHTFVCSLVTIGEDCFIAHGVMFINDLFETGRPAPTADTWRGTKIGNRVSIGSNATILPVDICDDVVIGAGAVVTKSITKPGIYAGNPAKLLRTVSA